MIGIFKSTWKYLKSAAKASCRVLFLQDVAPHMNLADKFIFIPTTALIGLGRSITDFLGSFALAKAVEIIVNDEKDPHMFGIPVTYPMLLYLTVGCYGFSRFAPFLVRLITVSTREEVNDRIIRSILDKTSLLTYADAGLHKNSLEQVMQYSIEISDLVQLVPNNVHQPLLSFALGGALVFVTNNYVVGIAFSSYLFIKTGSVFVVHSLLDATDKLREANSNFKRLIGRYKEGLVNRDVIKVFNRESFEKMVTRKLTNDYVSSFRKAIATESFSYFSSGILPLLTDIVLINFMISIKANVKLELMELLFLLNYLSVINASSSRFIEGSYRAIALMTHYEEINKILKLSIEDHSAEIKNQNWLERTLNSAPSIAFENVTFCYDAKRPILQNLTFNIKAGERCAIVGNSAAGKSTIANLLLRLYRPQSGTIKINERDINTIPVDEFCRIISFLPQNTHLFESDTVESNIAYGFSGEEKLLFDMYMNQNKYYLTFCDTKAHQAENSIVVSLDDEEDRFGTELNRKDEFGPLLDTDPQKNNVPANQANLYNRAVEAACVGNLAIMKDEIPPKANALSVGQKQRVSLARMLVRHSPIFVLDEATSALDSEIEEDVVSAIKSDSKNRTSITIAHRLNTIFDADKIVVLDQGKIVQEGTHEELIKKDGKYNTLWHLQTRPK